MEKKSLLVTGANGFIGQHLLKSLYKEYDIDILVRSSSQYDSLKGLYHKAYFWDQLEQVDKRYDAVVHLAGLAHDTKSVHDGGRYQEINVSLSQKITDLTIDTHSSLFIYLSSIKAMGEVKSTDALNERQPCKPDSPYGVSKLAVENYLENIKNEDFRYIALRPSLIYGEGYKGNLSKLVDFVDKGSTYPFGQIQNNRTLLYVGNLCEIIKALIEKPIPNGVYHAADDDSHSTGDLIRQIAKARHKTVRFIPIPRGLVILGIKVLSLLSPKLRNTFSKLLGTLLIDNAKIKSALGWAKMPFETTDSLKNTFKG
jgi:nucleoside-diphosphate-sugar epimerase